MPPSGKHVPAMYTPYIPLLYEKLGYAVVYILFLFLLQNIDCGYSLEPPGRVCVMTYRQKYKHGGRYIIT